MNIIKKFDDNKEIEIHQFNFRVKKAKSIEIDLLDGIFEHALIIVKDPTNKVRILFSFKSRLRQRFLAETDAHTTNGGISGPIMDGIWTLIVIKPSLRVTGKYQIEVRFDRSITELDENNYFSPINKLSQINLTHYNNSWLSAELHSHSYYSDGRVSMLDIYNAIGKRFNVYSLTDHSMVTTKFPKGDYIFLPGTELTFDNEYHYNLYGYNNLIDFTKYFKSESNINSVLEKCFSDLSKNNLLSINHIFAPDMGRQHNFNIKYFRLLEIINAPYSIDDNVDNEKAIRLFDFLWNKGYNLYAIGGSDAHKKSYHGVYPIGIPMNKIFVKDGNTNGVLNALKKGNIYILNNVEATAKYCQDNKEILPGSECKGWVSAIGSSNKVLEWRLIESGNCIYKENTKNFNYKFKISKGSYIRLEARDREKTVVFVNPLTNQHENNNQDAYIMDLLKEFESVDIKKEM
ncbi:CehA/McbA family metallohydrolase [Bombilactobacillus bombi]|uniref:CehA/McbA family metallohydrolase n=1 Tax=Bombilactobacillus bombi TaxID=1303590 RepID=UPI0015F99DD3|nr:CehA/McbA family metallohydrolase [Bombilactobacillus bombi]